MTLLFTAALIFLPDIGLWSLYREKHLVKPAEPAEPQVAGLSGDEMAGAVKVAGTSVGCRVRRAGSMRAAGSSAPC